MHTDTGQGEQAGGGDHTKPTRLEVLESGVAVIHLGRPEERVVTLTVERMQSLGENIAALKAASPAGAIFVGPHVEMFTAGADINAIRNISIAGEAEKLARYGQALFDEIAQLPFPTVAAISGPCVGGGCEMVLACTYRLISDHPSSQIGLPEIKLGILPGFGGTQRLPRLVGLPKALDIILAGKSLRPKQALACNLVNEIVPSGQLRKRAEQILLGEKKGLNRPLPLLPRLLTYTGIGRSFVKRRAIQTIERTTHGFYPAPRAALESIMLGLEQGMRTGLTFEAKELGRLIVTPESKALVRIFFLTEQSKAIGKSARRDVEHVHAVVLGAGVMGAGIAGVMARHECSVILKDTTNESIEKGKQHISAMLGKLSYLSETDKSFILNRIETTTTDSPNLGNATIAIEAIFENMDIKKKVLSELSKLLPPDAIIASNTSSLSVSEIATALENPERVVGMHFFNPVEKMPLIEIVMGERTSNKTIAIIAALASKLGKYSIVVKDVPGFLVNRILCPYITEAAHLLQEGYSIQAIDEAALQFGMPMGPIRLLDEVGLDVASHVSDIMVAGYGERMQGPGFAKLLAERKRFGKKSGEGFYIHSGKNAEPAADIAQILGLTQQTATLKSPEYIRSRLVLRLIDEAVRCLDEGVAGAPSPEAANQIDLGTVMGMGFPPFRGGVLHYADSLGAQAVYEELRKLEQECGNRFAPAHGIAVRAQRGLRFSEPL